MQQVWAALDNAGYTAAELNRVAGTVGVLIGAMWDDYQHYGTGQWQQGLTMPPTSVRSSLANRLSYFFDFNGPSLSIDTSCSSALTALHHAVTALRNGECGAAIVAGVNLLSHPYHQTLLQSLDLLSHSNRCLPFSQHADGWVAGEGVGVLVLKPLLKAEEQGDTIHASVLNTGISHGGHSLRYGAPNAEKQAQAIAKTFAAAGIEAASISYIEAAAPGASLADAAEIAALKQVFKQDEDVKPVYFGSVKANIGHLESASAMSQIAKVLAQFHSGHIFPSLSQQPLNPLLQLEHSRLRLADALMPWSSDQPRRALVNAFGATGSSAHAVLEEYRTTPATLANRAEAAHLIVLSAATEPQLMQLVTRFQQFLTKAMTTGLPNLADIAYTFQVGRVAMTQRLAVIASSHSELQQKLSAWLIRRDSNAELFIGQALDTVNELKNPARLTLSELAEAWVKGAKFDWQGLTEAGRKRVALPGYPFDNTTAYWPEAASAKPEPVAIPVSETHVVTLNQVQDYLKTVFSEVSEIPLSQLRLNAGFDQYGLTSLLIKQLTTRLERDLGELSKTLFFEYHCLQDLAQYFYQQHGLGLAQLLNLATPQQAVLETQPDGQSQAQDALYLADDIAIIGVSGCYPGAQDLEAFWQQLKQGADCITEVPKQRWDNNDSRYADLCRFGGFLSDIESFDALFFKISPREAESMDPQQRLFLQTAWHTVEDAGYNKASLQRVFAGKVGVFVGVMYGEYQLFSGEQSLGSVYGSIANRVSYTLDLHGPSLAVDTLCSSSLTALHQAVQSLRRGECLAALVGGVNLSLHPNKYRLLAQLTMSLAMVVAVVLARVAMVLCRVRG
ncbi:hypothetical protein VZ94_06845 [Methylocucumis oryzae]|uniref:Ketosynthase family 3 (KS3) domain-containing protein n=1 Tax=Methylocucumis oryzae TaxID=1632867 RepID=A0A0F3IKS9_9GAMM|nr:hypothetical protein VZ94_06845 [Methylocucumis oryzae]